MGIGLREGLDVKGGATVAGGASHCEALYASTDTSLESRTLSCRLGCARLTVWLNPWVGGIAGFGCSVLGIAVLAGHFSTIPAWSIPALLLGISLVQFGIVVSGCHMSLLEAREHSPPWSRVAPVIGGVILPEGPRSPSTLVGTYAGHKVAAFVQPGVASDGRLSGTPPRYVVQMVVLSRTPEWTLARRKAGDAAKEWTLTCPNDTFRHSLVRQGVLSLIDGWFSRPDLDCAGQCLPTVEATRRDGQPVVVYSAWLSGAFTASLTPESFEEQLDLLVQVALLSERAKAEPSSDRLAGVCSSGSLDPSFRYVPQGVTHAQARR